MLRWYCQNEDNINCYCVLDLHIIIQLLFGIQVYQSKDYISPVLKFFREGGTWTLTKMFKQNSKMGQKVDMVNGAR